VTSGDRLAYSSGDELTSVAVEAAGGGGVRDGGHLRKQRRGWVTVMAWGRLAALEFAGL